MNIKRAVQGFLLSFVFLFFFTYFIACAQWFFDGFFQEQAELLPASVSSSIENKEILELNPSAKSVISVETDLNELNKIIFEKDSNLPLPIASLTKLMTAVIVLDNYDPLEILAVSELANAQDPMRQDLKQGDVLSVRVLLQIMIVGSSNKAAYALSERIGVERFVDLMNQKAKSLGLNNTFFEDPTGLSAQNISTAKDLLTLVEYILKNYLEISRISRIKELYVPTIGSIENTNQLLGEFPETVCSKTGFTNDALGCLILVVDNAQNSSYLINIVLGAEDRFLEMKNLVDWVSHKCNL